MIRNNGNHMKPSMFLLLVNVTTIAALVFFVLQGSLPVRQAPVVGAISLIALNAATVFGFRMREKKAK
jgi:hypothetical protein